MDIGLKDRVVLVTGASSGIGAATAVAFGEEGARVAITYRSRAEQALATAERVEAAGGHALTVPMELQDPASIDAAVGAVEERWGHVEVLIANAVLWGRSRPDPTMRFEDVPVEEWQAMTNANLVGPALVARAVLPGMRAAGWGRIVFVSSGAAEEGVPGPGPYPAAKAGVHGLARTLAWEAGADGILVNVVAAGFTMTDRAWPVPPELVARLSSVTPSRRLSSSDDVARLLVFLGSAANRNVSGELVREGSSTGRSGHVIPA